MDANHAPDNHIPTWGAFHNRAARSSAVLIVRAQGQEQQQQEQQQQEQQQQEQQQQEMLPARRSLEVGSS